MFCSQARRTESSPRGMPGAAHGPGSGLGNVWGCIWQAGFNCWRSPGVDCSTPLDGSTPPQGPGNCEGRGQQIFGLAGLWLHTRAAGGGARGVVGIEGLPRAASQQHRGRACRGLRAAWSLLIDWPSPRGLKQTEHTAPTRGYVHRPTAPRVSFAAPHHVSIPYHAGTPPPGL